MRALTLKQPWLYAIEHLGKRVENRSWAIPKNLRDHWIALHAGKANEHAEWRAVSRIDRNVIPRQKVVFGAVTSVAKFGQFLVTAEHPYALNMRQQKWFIGPYGWVIFELVLLKEPLPCRGMLGLWTVPGDIEEKIKEQLPRLDFENAQREMQL